MQELDPPDLERCQADVPNGNTFMTLGGRPGLVRCSEKPVTIATEKVAGADGQIGSMSLCEACSFQMVKQLGQDFATFKRIGDL